MAVRANTPVKDQRMNSVNAHLQSSLLITLFTTGQIVVRAQGLKVATFLVRKYVFFPTLPTFLRKIVCLCFQL